MSRVCGWCHTHSATRRVWQTRVLDGETYATVAASTPFSPSAARRHMEGCLRAESLRQMRGQQEASLHVADFAARIMDLADLTEQIRASTNDPRVKLASVREERKTLGVLMQRLGIDSAETVAIVSEAQALASAVSLVLHDEPVILNRLAAELSSRGEADLADALSRLASSASARHVAEMSDRQPREVSA